ncbi:hypothetical protein FB567DRAFT_230557 [Paraphoma chrysanthemicola]|uniref:DUF202 domain-containing protein n=1 Tax=Paraphoma chrysanthemicola TaxID=798071 RepID=A0A8K0W236_9PLEO|nr:hypothetical protein FB567DRAFT_230557 [Paraphoma chrysanthemicola]
MASNQPRKRTSDRNEPTTSPSSRPADETSPIVTSAQSSAKDYAAIPSATNPRDQITFADPAAPDQDASTTKMSEDQRRASAERHAVAVEQQDSSRWRAFWERYGSVELENKGSVARDHLALERTFLAWLRTSLSFASIGIAITQLFRLNTNLSNPSQKHRSDNQNTPHAPQSVLDLQLSPQAKLRHLGKPLGATFIGISIVMLFIGFHRYFEAQHYVIRGKFPASRGSIVLVSAIAGALILSSLIVILVTAPTAFET